MSRFLLSVFLVLSLATASFATDDAESYDETVVVTAEREPVGLDETGSSVSVVEDDAIERRQIVYLGDALRALPGVSVGRSGGLGSLTQVRLRGGEANHVLVALDGVPINDAFAGDEVPLELLTLYDVQRVEVLRGPQSGLWGGDAVSGTIHLIGAPAGSAAGRRFQLETGSFGLVRGAGQIGLGDGVHRATLTGSFLDLDGTNVSRTGDEDDGSSNGTAAVAYRFAPESSAFALDVSARHVDSESDFDGVDFVVTGLPTDENRHSETTLSMLSATATLARPESPWRHRATVAAVASDIETYVDDVFSDSNGVDKLYLDWQSSVRFGATRDQRLTFAVDHENRDFSQRGTATPFGDPNQDQSMGSTGAVVEYAVGDDAWDWTASARHDRHDAFDDATTFRTTFVRRWHDGATRLRASAGTGFKPPTFFDRFGFFADAFVGNPDLEPEESFGWDVGVDRRLTDRIEVGLTWFDETLDNEIDGFFFDAMAGAFTAVNVDGESERNGVEATVRARPLDALHLALSYTYTDATEPGGVRELRRPEHSGHLQLHLAPAAWRSTWTLDATLTGERDDVFFPPFPQPSATVELESYVLVDLAAAFRMTERIEWIARVENALDETYEDVYGFATPGRAAYVGLRFGTGR